MFILYGLDSCSHCKRAINILKILKEKHKIPYEVYNMRDNREKEYYKKKNNMRTFPQIFFYKKMENENQMIKIGGADDLERLVFK
jgi:glutaredoxin